MKQFSRAASRMLPRAISVAVCLALYGCGGGMDISNSELVKKMAECNAQSNKTPGMAVACGNYIEECKRRGAETGNYIC